MRRIPQPHGQSSPDPSLLGEFLRARREAAGLSVRVLAERVGTSHPYITRVESGHYRQPSPDILHRIGQELGIPNEDLFALTGYTMPGNLPAFVPYLYAKYQIPAEAISELSNFFDYIRSKYPVTERPNVPQGRRVRKQQPYSGERS